jgi:ammonia channel protein AmtB
MKHCIIVGSIVQQLIEDETKILMSQIICGSGVLAYMVVVMTLSTYTLAKKRLSLKLTRQQERIGKMYIGVNLKS